MVPLYLYGLNGFADQVRNVGCGGRGSSYRTCLRQKEGEVRDHGKQLTPTHSVGQANPLLILGEGVEFLHFTVTKILSK